MIIKTDRQILEQQNEQRQVKSEELALITTVMGVCVCVCVWKGKGTKANQNKSNTNTWRILQESRPCGHSASVSASAGAIKEAKDSFALSLNLANRLISGTASVCVCILYHVSCI